MEQYHLVAQMIVNEGANTMATRHCSENSGKICRITQTKALPRKGNFIRYLFKYYFASKMYIKNGKKPLTIYFSLLITTFLHNCFGRSLYLGYFYTMKDHMMEILFLHKLLLPTVLFHMVVLMIVKRQLTIWPQDIVQKILAKYAK